MTIQNLAPWPVCRSNRGGGMFPNLSPAYIGIMIQPSQRNNTVTYLFISGVTVAVPVITDIVKVGSIEFYMPK